jgi:hypothetical protein
MLQATQELKRQEWSVEELDALEAIELPAREAMTTCSTGGTGTSGLLSVSANVNPSVGVSLGNVSILSGGCGCS